MSCHSTDRMIADSTSCARQGTIRWDARKSLWAGGMAVIALVAGPLTATPGAVLLCILTTGITICLGHSIGMHRLLIHRSFDAPLWLERLLVWLGTLVGMAGPVGMMRLHDMRDWAQRQTECHDFHAHRAPMWKDYLWQVHCRLDLDNPPRFQPERRVTGDRFYRFIEATWMAQQLPLAVLFFAIGGWPFVVWGIAVRVTLSLTGHWLIGHLAHRRGPQGWVVDGAAVQGHDVPAAAWLSFGEAWHCNHHAFPASARLGLEKGQADPGWWVLLLLQKLGLVGHLNQPDDLPPRKGLRRLPSHQR